MGREQQGGWGRTSVRRAVDPTPEVSSPGAAIAPVRRDEPGRTRGDEPHRLGAKGLIAALALAATALAACSGASGPTARGRTSARSGATVSIKLVAFNPPTIDVKPGTTVTWSQQDVGSFHTVTSGTVQTDATGGSTFQLDGRFDSGRLAENQTFSFTFTEPGTYPYFCSIHPATMRGEVRVR